MQIILDCNWICYRAAFGMSNLSYDNKQVHIIFDFIRQLLVLAKKFDCSNFVFCFDSRNSWRKIYSPIYKSNRHKDLTPEQEADLVDTFRQMVDLRQIVLPYMGFRNIFYQSGYEADDLIAKTIKDNEGKFMVVSSDEDLFQLLDSDVNLYNFKRILSYADFCETYKILPIQWPEVKAIAGCSGDNVIGIRGIGEKSAAKYLTGKLKGKSKEGIESIEGCRIKAFNLPLVLLPFNGKKPLRSCQIVPDEISEDRFSSMFGQYGFRSFLNEENWKKWGEVFRF